jgi:thiamine biosynthesis lipoprotein
LDWARRAIRFDREGVSLDLGGIAKGYAVDRAVDALRRAGVPSALVSAGGSTIYAIGAPPDASRWTVDIEDPIDASKIAFTVGLKDGALSVAGASHRFFEHEGMRYSHIMDPRSGRPVRGVLGVIVEATTGTSGDAADDVLFVQGVERGRAFLRRHPEIHASFLIPRGSSGWSRVSGGRRSRKS